MNYLAHIHLARHSDDAMLGALLGDFVFGTSGPDAWPGEIRREILLHRKIDRFTDDHPAVTAARALFPDGRRRYAGIALDVYYDHLLARDWHRHGEGDLDAFTRRFYAHLLANHARLPPRLQAIAPLMAKHDWLGSYRERDSVDRAITRIATRLSRNGDKLVGCLPDLRRHEDALHAGFERFFPDLVAHVAGLRDPGGARA
jgi:acyl carrier protein phosphodiesterase